MNTAELFVFEQLNEYEMPAIDDAIYLIQTYRTTEWYESKQLILDQWDTDDKTIRDIINSVMTCAFQEEYLTLQALVGKLNHKIKLPEEIDRLKIIADIIGLINQTDLIDIVSEPGDYHTITTDYVVEDVPEEEKHMIQYDRPAFIDSNQTDFMGHMIIGHVMNRQKQNIRLSHYNKMAQIKYVIDQDFIAEYEESPKHWPDTGEKEEQWEFFKEKSTEKYEELGTKPLYIPYKPDSRGRSYAQNYYISPQGNSFKKAMLSLADTMLVTEEIV